MADTTLIDRSSIASELKTGGGVNVQTHGLSKAFADREVLRSLDLRVNPGELVAVVGKSGCGKSTLLRLISGLDEPSTGWIEIAGDPLFGLNRYARLMFQDAALLPWKSVQENVALAAPRRSSRAQIATDALDHVGLQDRAREWPSVLSGGQRQRVALARALASNAKLLLFDEPLGALDALTRLEMQSLIERLWLERGFSAILVTHDVEEALALADRVLLMASGQVTFETTVVLDRPRDRSSRQFIELKEVILERILGSR
jgi:sulfonate transport system ATP-binding protein